MSLEKIVRKIPSSRRETASERLVDIVLKSSDSKRMPSSLAKTILYYWQQEQLVSEVGLQRLLEASLLIDKEKTTAVLRELGFEELAAMLQES